MMPLNAPVSSLFAAPALPCGRLVLGTAQLGMSYGIANQSGQPSPAAAGEMIAAAWERGVRFFDTAQDYGESETILGEVLARRKFGDAARIVSKLGAAALDADEGAIGRAIEGSLARLRVPRLAAVLLHREDDLDRGLHRPLLAAKRAGLVEHVGVSVYSAARALQALAIEGIDVIQVAASVFDRRMARAGVFGRAAERGTSVFVRSIYLQGLALMEPAAVPGAIAHATKAVRQYAQFCASRGLDRRRFAIDHVRRMLPEGFLVIGAETTEQVRGNCAAAEAPALPAEAHEAWGREWPEDHPDLVDPRRWKIVR